MDDSGVSRQVVDALMLAADLWISQVGPPLTRASTDNEFAMAAESVFWRVMENRGLLPVHPEQ